MEASKRSSTSSTPSRAGYRRAAGDTEPPQEPSIPPPRKSSTHAADLTWELNFWSGGAQMNPEVYDELILP